MSHEVNNQSPTDAGRGHLLSNILVFSLLFGMFLLGMYVLTWSDGTNVWPFGVCLVLAFLAFFIPQGILGRADTGYDLAEGNRTDKKETSAKVDS
ncbi:putative membrane protein [Arthrobacter sp. CAN_A214]|uniref:hypothetical protein n=1 Tax=Arthrobacter sp. CAN_A214 TaxID=2787720 RepID=UPI0018CB15B2